MGIELDDDCEQAMYEIENDYKDPQFEFIHKKVDFEFSDGTLEEARNEAHELIDRVNAKKKKKYDDPLFFDDAFPSARKCLIIMLFRLIWNAFAMKREKGRINNILLQLHC